MFSRGAISNNNWSAHILMEATRIWACAPTAGAHNNNASIHLIMRLLALTQTQQLATVGNQINDTAAIHRNIAQALF